MDPIHLHIGALTCTILCYGSGELTEAEIPHFFPHDTGALLAAMRALPGPLQVSRNVLLLEIAGQRVLVDSGQGWLDPDDPGLLLEGLDSLNLAPDAIDTIIITHYHRDHTGGLFDRAGQLVFPRARIIVPQSEHAAKTDPAALAELPPLSATIVRQLAALDSARLHIAAPGAELVPGVQYVALPGHTPGHCGVLVEAQGARLLHAGDAILLPIQVNCVDSALAYDADPAQASATRHKLLEQVAAEALPLLAYHFPFPGTGTLVRAGAELCWAPMP